MKKKYLLSALALPVLGLSFLGAGIVSAHGGFRNMSPEDVVKMHETKFENGAQLLGMSVDEVKNAWAQGKDLKTLAAEKGISETDLQAKMQAQRKQEMNDTMKTLVEKGVITQTQADQRLKFMETKMLEKKDKGFGRMGMHRGQKPAEPTLQQ